MAQAATLPSGFVSGGIVAGCASGDPTFTGAVAIGATAGGLGAVAGSVLEQGIDHGKVDPGKVIHDGVIGVAGGLLGAGLGKALGGSVGSGSLSVPTGMTQAVNLNGTLTFVLTHTDIQQKALVMAGVMAAATQLTAQAARGLAMAVQGGFNGRDPATEMAAKEAENVVAPVAPRTIVRIGDLTAQEQAALARTWEGGPRSALPLETREALAAHYRRVGSQLRPDGSPVNPPDFAQRAFQEASARYLLGEGPNPGPDVHEFARQTGIPILRRGGGQ